MKNLLKKLKKKIINKIIFIIFIYLYNQKSYEMFFKVYKYINIYKNMEYIWYCPRQSCGCIVVKTSEPILKLGKVFKCKRCQVAFKSEELIKHNKRNLRKYIEEIEKD